MSVDWPKHQLSEFVNVKHGFAFKGEFFKSEETLDFLVTPGNFAIGGGFRSEKFKFYDGPVPEDYILSEGDLVVTMTDLSKQADTLGYSALIPDIEGRRLLHNQRVGLIEFKNDDLDKTYLYFLLRSREYRHHVIGGATGTTVKHTSPTKILSFEFNKPPKDVQREIGGKLIVLEEKIQLNRQTNQTLEQIAQAIFKSWFIDFDPVKAKIAAKQEWARRNSTAMDGGSDENAGAIFVERAAMCAISGKKLTELQKLAPEVLEQLETTAALFPDALVESELGLVPEGWGNGALADIAEVVMGQSPKGDTYNDSGIGTVLVNGPVEFGDYHPKKIKWTTTPTKMSQLSDLIVCVRGSTTGRFVKSDGEYCLGRGVCAIRSKNQAFTDRLFKWEINKLLDLATGSTFPSWSGPTLKNYPIIVPESTLMEVFSKAINTLDNKISANEFESGFLSKCRDSLLPKLLSGELSLSSQRESSKEVA